MDQKASKQAIFFTLAVFLSVSLLWTAAFGGATFSAPSYSLTISTPINTRGQSVCGSTTLTLTHDVPCTLVISVAESGDEVLHSGSNTLNTAYMLTGSGLMNPDATWVGSSSFVGHSYTIPGAGPMDNFVLQTQGTVPANVTPEAGTYSANLILTVSW